MRKLLFFMFLFLFSFNVKAGEVHISKRNIDSNDYANDCDFLLYDSSGNIVDSWIQDNMVHIINVPIGTYTLVERPFIMDSFSDEMSVFHSLDISSDDIVEFTLYNKKIATPRNLCFHNMSFCGILLIVFGLLVVNNRKFNFFNSYNNVG